MSTATKMADDTRIREIVTGPRAVKHLEAAGIGNLGELRAKGMAVVFQTKYVGEVAIRELKAAIGPQDERPVADPDAVDPLSEFEEGSHPLNLERLPGGPARISWLPSHKVSTGGGAFGIQKHVWIEFDEHGSFKLTQRAYLMRKYNRNEERVIDAIEAKAPWRQECVDMIRGTFQAYGTGFIILTD